MCTYYIFISSSHSFQAFFLFSFKQARFSFFLFIHFKKQSSFHSSLPLLSFPIPILILAMASYFPISTQYLLLIGCQVYVSRTTCVSDLFKIKSLTCIVLMETEPKSFKLRYPSTFRNIETGPPSVTKLVKLVSHL